MGVFQLSDHYLIHRTVKLIVKCFLANVLQNHFLFFLKSYFFNHTTVKLTGHAQWTKTGTQPALTARVEPPRDVGNVGATFETVADETNGENMNEKFLETMNDKIGIKTNDVLCGTCTKSPRQLIADAKVNDTTMITAVTKNNANEMVPDNVPPTNDDKLDHLASNVACQDHREECPLDKTGTTMLC